MELWCQILALPSLSISSWLPKQNYNLPQRAATRRHMMTHDSVQLSRTDRVGPGSSGPACLMESQVTSCTVMCYFSHKTRLGWSPSIGYPQPTLTHIQYPGWCTTENTTPVGGTSAGPHICPVGAITPPQTVSAILPPIPALSHLSR